MSDDFINNLTLNFLISRNQLQKLNKKIKNNTDEKRLNDMDQWKDRIQKLFNDLLVNDAPNDLLLDVKNAFENFIDKSVYYFKSHDQTIELENDRKQVDIYDDYDYDKEERDIENGNYIERTNEEEPEEEEEESNPIEVDTNTYTSFSGKTFCSNGKKDIQSLELNWFENVRKQNTKNKIIPRKKE
jgi:hypothetical protein